MKQSNATAIAMALGATIAHVQDGIDDFLAWGFSGLKKLGEKPQRERGGTYVKAAAATGRAVLGFLGTVGDAYYEEYKELKRTT